MSDEANKTGNNADVTADRAVERDLWCKGSEVAGDAVNAPSDRKIGGNGHGDGVVVAPMVSMLAVTIDPDLGQPAFVEVNGERFEPVKLAGHADTEAEAMASFDRLNCPTCGGSGHVDDAVELVGRRSRRIVELDGTVAALTIKLADAEGSLVIVDAERERLRRLLADMTTNRDALDQACKRKGERIDAAEGCAKSFRQAIVDNAGALSSMAAERDAATAERDRLIGRLEFRHGEIMRLGDRIVDLTNENARLERQVGLAEDAMLGNATQRNEARARILAVEIERDTARDIAALFRERLTEIRDYLAKEERFAPTIKIIDATLETVPGDMEVERAIRRSRDEFVQAIHDATPNGEYIEVQHHTNGDWSVAVRPRCRVVTSPRFYGEEAREAAVAVVTASFDRQPSAISREAWYARAALVDMVAERLGMRRAAK